MVSALYRDDHSTVVPTEIPRQSAPVVRMLTANGSRDSHAVVIHATGRRNGSPRAGTPYTTASWADIRSLVETPAAVPKDRARLVVLSSYIDHDGRTHEVQRERGVFHGLAVDIDTGNPSIDDVVAAVQRVVGNARAEVYSSSSAAPDKRKWRVLIPLSQPVAGADYPDIQLALFGLLGQHGLTCDAALARAAQPVYLPNVPPERRGPDGRPVFYQYRHIDGPDLVLSSDHAILAEVRAARDRRAAEAAAAAAKAEEYSSQRLAYVEATGDDFEPIRHFNEHHTVASMLSRYGFVRKEGGRGSHWRSPLSESGSYSTEDRGDHWVTVSNWAHAHGVGRVSNSGNRHGDAFDLFVHFEHRADRSAAVRAYAAEVRPRRDRRVDAPDQPVVVEAQPKPQGPTRTLADWRTEVIERRAEAVTTPGMISLDRSPTGSGKSTATNQALTLVSSSLTVLPTHANVVERVAEMQAAGIDAVAFPDLSAENCQNYENASQARGVGLVVGAAVCPGCPLNRIPNPSYPGKKPNGKDEPKTIPGPCHQADQYQGLMRAAREAAHKVGTHERLRRSSKTAEGVAAVVIDENPEGVVAPTESVSVRKVEAVDHLAHAIQNYWYSEADPDQKAFAGAMRDVVARIQSTCAAATTGGTRQVDLTLGRQVPQNWQRLLFGSIRQVGVGRDLNSKALMLVTMAAAGDLLWLKVVTDLTAKGRLVHHIVGSWRPTLPEDAAVVMLDATGNADDIAAAAGREVVDCTPQGHLPLVHPVVQIPVDICGKTESSTVAGQVEAWLAENPGKRVGLIGHKKHIRALIDGGQLSAPARERVAKWCYFGQGPDRGSNDWHQTRDGSPACEHILILGTVRANPTAYRSWLAQHGLHDAAGKVDGDWGPKDWEAVTVDGQPVTLPGVGYRDPDWHRAYTAVSRAAGTQGVGRGRSILAEGIPVTIWSNEPGPYPIAPTLAATPAAARETAAIVRRLVSQPADLLADQSAKNPIENPYREICASAVPTGACVQAIMVSAGIKKRAAQVRLAQCQDAGLLVQPRRGYWSTPESADAPIPATVPPVAQPEPPAPSGPPPAIVSPPVRAVVIAATGPSADHPPVDVAAQQLPEVTTATCTSTAPPPAADSGFDDLMQLVEERAAILEYDANLDRETADRLAREMVLGRDAVHRPAEADDIVAGVDHAALAVRSQPFVGQTLDRLPGRVRIIDDRDDPFAGRRGQQLRRAGTCRCGHDDWVQVSIHGGQSVRVDCRNCDRFGWFGVWYGRRLPSPYADPPRPPAEAATAAVPVFDVAPVGQVLVPC